MSRFRSSSAYGFHVSRVMYDCFRITWTVDRYYKDSRLRHPRTGRRETDFKGAVRFAKKHGLAVPPSP